ncbi:MAG: fumarylacetoacetate hydrolase family protein [Actinobacteria bacterium]|nr:fumarylacetoacetate hydrolase family protein [Actinomycetota bacterium]
MRFTTIRTTDGTRAARVEGEELVLLPQADVGALLASGEGWRDAAGDERVALAGADFAPLVPRPEKIFCVGLNYADHAAEANLPVLDHPTLFAMFHRALIGPGDELVLPDPEVTDWVDWELELGVVVGSPIRHASPEEALAGVAGYTIVDDISMRDWQTRTSQYLAGKTFEASTPVGPFLVTPDEIDPTAGLAMKLTVNGETMQESSTDQLVFGVAELLSYISEIITLVPGDLIATGTMAGVGHVRTPPVYLADGDVIECSIEGIGSQTTRCVAAATREKVSA